MTSRYLPLPPVIPRDTPRPRRWSSFPPRRRRSSMQSRAAASSKPPGRRRQRQMIIIILASTLAVIKASGLTTSSKNSNVRAWQVPWRGAVASLHKGPRLLPPAVPTCQWRALGRQPLWLREMDRSWTLPANRLRTLPALAATKHRATITVGNAKRRCSALTLAAWYAPNGKKRIAPLLQAAAWLLPLQAAACATTPVTASTRRAKQRGREARFAG